MKKFALFIVGVASIAGMGFVIDAQSRIPVERPPGPTEPRLIFAPGRVEGATPEIELRLQLPGRIREVCVREGQFVEAGAVLLRLDDEQNRHEVELVAADLALANAQLERLVNGARPQEIAEASALWRAKSAEFENAQLSLRRINDLLEDRVVSQKTADDQSSLVATLTAQTEAAKAHLDQLQAPARREDVLMAQARVQSAAARLDLAKVQLSRTVLRAPSRGQILKAQVETGELTGPDSPDPAIVMADTTRLRVRAFVEEMDAPRVQIGMGCTISVDGLPGRRYQGQVVELSPQMSRKELWSDRPTERLDTKTRQAWIELQSAPELFVGVRVDVAIAASITGPGFEQRPAPNRSSPTRPPQPGREAATRTVWERAQSR